MIKLKTIGTIGLVSAIHVGLAYVYGVTVGRNDGVNFATKTFNEVAQELINKYKDEQRRGS